jgi:hypothetical protein
VCVIGAGLSLANCVQLAEVYASAGPTWAAWEAIVFMAVTCGLTLVIAVALRPVEPEPPAPTPQPPAPVVDDLRPLVRPEGQSYEATMQRRKTAPDLALPEPQIARVVMYLLDGRGRASARQLAHICNQTETAKVREWLLHHRWADEHNSTAVLNQAGREALAELLPRLARE